MPSVDEQHLLEAIRDRKFTIITKFSQLLRQFDKFGCIVSLSFWITSILVLHCLSAHIWNLSKTLYMFDFFTRKYIVHSIVIWADVYKIDIVIIIIDPMECAAQLKADLKLNPQPIQETEEQIIKVPIKPDPRRPQQAKRSIRLPKYSYEWWVILRAFRYISSGLLRISDLYFHLYLNDSVKNNINFYNNILSLIWFLRENISSNPRLLSQKIPIFTLPDSRSSFSGDHLCPMGFANMYSTRFISDQLFIRRNNRPLLH